MCIPNTILVNNHRSGHPEMTLHICILTLLGPIWLGRVHVSSLKKATSQTGSLVDACVAPPVHQSLLITLALMRGQPAKSISLLIKDSVT